MGLMEEEQYYAAQGARFSIVAGLVRDIMMAVTHHHGSTEAEDKIIDTDALMGVASLLYLYMVDCNAASKKEEE